MVPLIFFLLNLAASLFKPKSRLAAENAALRQQLMALQRKVRGRVQFTNSDRLFFIQLYRWFPSALTQREFHVAFERSPGRGKMIFAGSLSRSQHGCPRTRHPHPHIGEQCLIEIVGVARDRG
jgi:hypothetical protein